jgi:hypothetical protein
MLAAVSRAREAGGAMPTDLLDLLGPPGWCSGCWPHDGEVAGGAGADSFFVISGSGRTMELGRSARPTMMMSASPGRGGGGRTQRGTGSSINDGPLASLVVLTRARRGGAIERGDESDPLEPAGRGGGCWPNEGEVDVAAVADFSFLGIGRGRTMELGRRRGANDADVGFAWSGRRRASAASHGVIDNRSPNSAALTLPLTGVWIQ